MSNREVGVIGGVAAPHAPQFFTLPPTEDADQVARIEATMRGMGERLAAMEPDAVVIVANDHLENFLLEVVPAFTILRGPVARGSFAGRDYRWEVDTGAATKILMGLQEQGFDPAASLNAPIGYEFGIPLTFLGMPSDIPLIPIFVNSYVPPQPSPDRCYAFGQALHRVAAEHGMRLVIVASGGLSHYPGTALYGEPDLATDEAILARLRVGNLRSLLTFDAQGLDKTGNVEARSWLILAGALGEQEPSEVVMEASWHHNYAIVSWDSSHAQPEQEPLHYPIPDPKQMELYEALFELRSDRGACLMHAQSPETLADKHGLTGAERDAFLTLDEDALNKTGMHPLLGFLARLGVTLSKRDGTKG